jgi:hypothetical protein
MRMTTIRGAADGPRNNADRDEYGRFQSDDDDRGGRGQFSSQRIATSTAVPERRRR